MKWSPGPIAALATVLMLSPAARADAAGETPDAQPQAPAFVGTVIETTNASRYTYVLVDTGKARTWVAAPTFSVKTGDSVRVSGAMLMKDFHSTAMNKTFAELYFAERITPARGASLTNAPVAMQLPPGHPATRMATEKTSTGIDSSKIQKPEGGKTLAEIWKTKRELSGKRIVIRARVVKIVPNVMGRNWVHLQDGTASDDHDDLTITTQDLAPVGATVTVSGIVRTDKDFGSGYTYDVIIEDASMKAN